MFISLSLFLCVYVRIRGIEKEAYILLFVQQRESSRKDKVCQREEGEKRERETLALNGPKEKCWVLVCAFEAAHLRSQTKNSTSGKNIYQTSP